MKTTRQNNFTFRNILDNAELVETLENTKKKVDQVFQKLQLGERTRDDIEKLRDAYRPVAEHGALIYFSMMKMSIINKMVRQKMFSR